jgi:hypothetical protein
VGRGTSAGVLDQSVANRVHVGVLVPKAQRCSSRADDLQVIVSVQEPDGDVKSERTIDLELLFAEELVARRLVREQVVAAGVVADIVVFVAGER